MSCAKIYTCWMDKERVGRYTGLLSRKINQITKRIVGMGRNEKKYICTLLGAFAKLYPFRESMF